MPDREHNGPRPEDKSSRKTADAWPSSWDSGRGGLEHFLTGRGRLDAGALLALARETGRSLSFFRPPSGYRPRPLSPDRPLTAVIAQSLGAPSLADFFARLPGPVGARVPDPNPVLAHMPRGPEDIPEALGFVDAALADCERSARIDPRRQASRKAGLEESRAALVRARQLGAGLEELAERWPGEAREALGRALELKAAADLLLGAAGPASPSPDAGAGRDASSSPPPPEGSAPVSLTGLSRGLSERLASLRAALAARLGWRESLRALSDEVEALSAAAGREGETGPGSERFWPGALAGLRGRLAALERDDQSLSREREARARGVAAALEALERGELEVGGRAGADLLERAGLLSSSVETLLRDTLALARDLRECWTMLPPLVGRPRFLDRNVLAAAAHLGRAMSLGEEIRSLLGRLTGRLSSTCEIRAKAAAALGLPDRENEFRAGLSRAGARLAALGRLVLYKTRAERLEGEAERRRGEAGRLEARALSQEALAADYKLRAERLEARSETLEARQSLHELDLERLRQSGQEMSLTLEGRDGEIRVLRQRLRAAGPRAEGPGAAALGDQLRAVEAERDRLEDHLGQARDRLNSLGQLKARVLKSVERARAALSKAGDEKSELEKSRRALEVDLTTLRRRHTRLAEYFTSDRKALQRLEKNHAGLREQHLLGERALAGHRAERARLSAAVKDRQEKIAELEAALGDAAERAVLLDKKLAEAGERQTALALEEAAKADRLSEAGKSRERMSETVSSLRAQLDRVTMARAALKKSWERRGRLLAEGEAERDQLRLKLDKHKRNLVALVTKRQRLLSEMGRHKLRLDGYEQERARMLEDLERARAGAAETERLQGELGRLRDEVETDLKPLVSVLAMALWRGQAQLKAVQDGVDGKIADQRRGFQAREAGVRVAAAAKEIDYLELLAARDKELGDLKGERDSLLEEFEALRKGSGDKDEDLARRSWLCRQLSLALSAESMRGERSRRSLQDFRRRLDTEKEEATALRTELEGLVQNQARALADHKAWLSELVPLVGFFLESGRELWAGPGKEDARDAVLYFLTKENAQLGEELTQLKNERQALTAERRGYIGLNESIRKRLAELRPLVEFLVDNFVANAASLAQVTMERSELLRSMGRADPAAYEAGVPLEEAFDFGSPGEAGEGTRPVSGAPVPAAAPGAGISSAAPAAPMSAEAARARRELARLARENSRLELAAGRAEAALETARARVAALEGETGGLLSAKGLSDEELAAARARAEDLDREKAELVGLLQNQETSLGLARSEAGRLVLERDQLKSEAAAGARELETLRRRVEAMEKGSAADGRLEAAWAALTYVNSKAGDAMGSLQTRIDKQALELESAFGEMRRKDEEIVRLKGRQDRLSLLWWTIFQLASEGPNSGLPEGAEGVGGDDLPRPVSAFPAGASFPALPAGPPSLGRGSGPEPPPAGSLPPAPPPPGAPPAAASAAAAAPGVTAAPDVPGGSEPPASPGAPAGRDVWTGDGGRGLPAGLSNGDNDLHFDSPAGVDQVQATFNDLGPDFLEEPRQDGDDAFETADLFPLSPGDPASAVPPAPGRVIAQAPAELPGGGTGPADQTGRAPRPIRSAPPGQSGQTGQAGQTGPVPADGSPETGDNKNELGGSLLSEIRKVARRSLLTLLFAALAVFPAGGAGADVPYPLGGADSPMILEYSPTLEAPPRPAVARLSSSYLGRVMDLRVLSLDELARGQAAAEEKAMELVVAQARRLGVSEECWLRLIRSAYRADATVNLQDLEGSSGPVTVLKNSMPALAGALGRTGRGVELAGATLPVLSSVDRDEAAFWHRLFGRVKLSLKDDSKALDSFAARLARRDEISSPMRLAYGGEKAPLRDIETMGPDEAREFVRAFVVHDFGRTMPAAKRARPMGKIFIKRGEVVTPIPRGGEPKRLAADLVAACALFKLPRTFVLSVLHSDFNSSARWPDTMEFFSWGVQLRTLLAENSHALGGGPRICDLDVVCARLSSISRTTTLSQCYHRLQHYLFAMLAPENLLFRAELGLDKA
ncbi:MAG: hypothetical protein LBO05_13420 [Deltaproteobacteria bacterium]|jgi:chromosome segregation ATPase|nr:hypothetical protein [Deltaproteobacteria bacterium]